LHLWVLEKLFEDQLVNERVLIPFLYQLDSFVDVNLNNLPHLPRNDVFKLNILVLVNRSVENGKFIFNPIKHSHFKILIKHMQLKRLQEIIGMLQQKYPQIDHMLRDIQLIDTL
jgi:hypothetical protein